jgi:hypothetical protein
MLALTMTIGHLEANNGNNKKPGGKSIHGIPFESRSSGTQKFKEQPAHLRQFKV